MLKALAKHFIERDLSNYCFVFPNRRAGLFFKKYIQQEAKKTLIVPEIVTIDEIICSYSPLKCADQITLLFELYKSYKAVRESVGFETESFDTFVSFGQTLLRDFSDIDRYLVDAHGIFTNITELQQLTDPSYLTDNQLEALEKIFIHKGGKQKLRDKFASDWSMLYPLYTDFKERLKTKGIAYQAMIYRSVIEENTNGLETKFDKVIFVGFNALDKVEEAFFKALGSDKTDFYWDYNLPGLNDPGNPAGRFVQKYKEKFKSREELEETESLPETEFYNIITPSMTAQTIEARKILERLDANNINTAVVLLDENLLLPMLLSLPFNKDNRPTINVTMGFSISHTAIIEFIEEIILLQKNITFTPEGEIEFYHKHLLALLSHPFIQKYDIDAINKLKNKILSNNIVKIGGQTVEQSIEEIENKELLKSIFKKYDEQSMLDSVIETLNLVTTSNTYEEACLSQTLLSLGKLNKLLKENNISLKAIPLLQILKQVISAIKVAFQGEPLEGLQIMGTLETRCLSFENIIFISFNEGIFPASDKNNSYIPYNIRKAFDLPTTEHQDAVYAYNFYRLVARAKRVYMISDGRTDNLKSGEPSRYLKQLKYIYNKNITELEAGNSVKIEERATSITKPQDWVERFSETSCKSKHVIRLSASAMSMYLRCPWQFYINKYLHINEEDEITEIMESNQLGTIFHKAIENIYKDLSTKHGGTINKSDIEALLDNLHKMEEYVIDAFCSEYLHINGKNRDKVVLGGVNLLMEQLILSYVKKVLKEDLQKTPFLSIARELPCKVKYVPDDLASIAPEGAIIKGYIDRVDLYINEKGEKCLRLIDYKTGSAHSDLQKKMEDPANETTRQLMLYRYFVENDPNINFQYNKIELCIYQLSKLGKDDYSPLIPYNEDTYTQTFLDTLKNIVKNILDPAEPITKPKSSFNTCTYCKFTDICKRLK